MKKLRPLKSGWTLCCFLGLLALLLGGRLAHAFDAGVNDLHGGTPVGNSDNDPESDDESDDDSDDPSNSDGDENGGDDNEGDGEGDNGGNDDDGQEGEPVSLFSGQFHFKVVDIDIKDRMPLRLKRFYRSASPYQGMFGRGWNMEYNERIFILAQNGDLLRRYDNAAREVYTNLHNNTYAAPRGRFNQLWRNGDGSYTLREKHGGLRLYNSEGCLVEIQDRNGNQLLLDYEAGGKLPINAISDYSHITNAIVVARDYRLRRMETAFNQVRSGRYIQFSYDQNGRVTQAADFTGRAWKYTYDKDGNGFLEAVTTPPVAGFEQGLTTRYTYNPTNHHGMVTLTDPAGNNYLTNFYDSSHRISRQYWGKAVYSYSYPNDSTTIVTNGNRFRVERTFDAQGNVLTRKEYSGGLRPGEPAFHLTTYEYNVHGQQTKAIMPATNVYARRYDDQGNLLETRIKKDNGTNRPEDLVHTFTYEPRFNLRKTAIDPAGNTTTYVYDYEDAAFGSTNGRLMRVLYQTAGGSAAVPILQYTYNPYGQIETRTDADGYTSHRLYDPVTGRLVQRIEAYGTPQAATNTMTYDARGNLLSHMDAAGHVTTYAYDDLDRRIQVTAPAPFNYVTRYTYDARGEVSRVERQTGDPAAPWQIRTFEHDGLGRVSRVTDPLGRLTRYEYDGTGNLTNTIKASGQTVASIYDERDLLWKRIINQTNVTQYTYDGNGRLSEIKDSLNRVMRMIRDRYDRLATNLMADGSMEIYRYDQTGMVTVFRDRSGQSTTNYLDGMERLVQRNNPDGSTNLFLYSLGGKLIQAEGPEGLTQVGYDAAHRVASVTNADNTVVGYEYDGRGNCSKILYPDGSFVLYAYDALDRLTNIAQSGGQSLARYGYDGLNRRVQLALANGIVADYQYDPASQLTNLIYRPASGGASLARFQYEYDSAGNRTAMTTTQVPFAGRHVYEYDLQEQLTRVTYPAGYPFRSTSYQYDGAGNRLKKVDDLATTTYQVNARNQYSHVNGTPLPYDLNGNLLHEGTTAYGYDYANRLVQVTSPQLTATYQYDMFGRRLKKTVNGQITRYVYAGKQLIAEYNESGQLLRKYIVSRLDQPVLAISAAGESYYHYDALGNVVFQTDAAGTKIESFAYDVYGQPDHTPAGSGAFLFAGSYYDSESGLYWMRARHYSPALGRFLQEDTWRNYRDLNPYLYVRNNPVNVTDPFGMEPGDEYATQDEAGRAALNDIYQDSVDNNREYGGYIYQNENGSYSYTEPVEGTEAGLDLGEPPDNTTADYHSHGADSNGVYDDEHFSDTDTNGNDASNTDGYLVTPDGDMQRYDHDTGGKNSANDIGDVGDSADDGGGDDDGGDDSGK